MRQIKFRAWDTSTKTMLDPFGEPSERTHALTFFGRPFSYSQGRAPFTHWDGNDYILMQFTGLRDKNGKEIYEGDIYRPTHYHESDTYQVFFQAGAFVGGKNFGDGHPLGWDDEKSRDGKQIWCEVIGNIYENPELLSPSTPQSTASPSPSRSN